jgi:hypothetical protein
VSIREKFSFYLANEEKLLVAVGFGESGSGVGSVIDRDAVAVTASGPAEVSAAHRTI